MCVGGGGRCWDAHMLRNAFKCENIGIHINIQVTH